ncbi:motile sperm domain-containing protein 3-like [Denticeps clupeoides]|uniref:motile sperm domain-containing protein 3-like n=1 Tax=Denticeps clupeoides TaxID=299321 RepID=UPI0010A590C8|nr:motile sperm domain-containing protein 3-like [Denticeps clupeoides]XP_028822523.1 motile sperm domain-containing protein 3-like [Denticeps clupeoides]
MRRPVRGGEGSPLSPRGPSLPVFVFPADLLFYSGQCRRVLTLYNPYSFPMGFKMLCTAPSLYTVLEAEGRVRARSCVDIVVRHQDVSARNWGRKDRFRLDVWGGGRTGSRLVWAELKRQHQTPGEAGGRPPSVAAPTHHRPPGGSGNLLQFLVYAVAGLVCVAVLMLPLEDEPSPVVPSHVHVTASQKLACAYVLGLLTMVFLR